MRLERSDLLKQLKPFYNGCSYRAIQCSDGMAIETGCYHLINLQAGAGKFLQELIGREGNNKVMLSDIPLDEPYQEVQYEILGMREQCTHCGGTTHTRKTLAELKETE